MAQGYIQFEGDPDKSGRHDHFLINMFGGFIGEFRPEWKSKLPSTKDDQNSPTDTFANQAGRSFGELLFHDGAYFPGGVWVNKSVFSTLCNEKECQVKHKGPVTDEIATEIGIGK